MKRRVPGAMLQCVPCGFTAPLDMYDCGGMRDGVVICPVCWEHIDVKTGLVAEEEVEQEPVFHKEGEA